VSAIKWYPPEKEGIKERTELNLGDIYLIRGHVAFYREEIQVNVEEMGIIFRIEVFCILALFYIVKLTFDKYFYWVAESEYNHFTRQSTTTPQLPKGPQ
jgi:hypothetical protein